MIMMIWLAQHKFIFHRFFCSTVMFILYTTYVKDFRLHVDKEGSENDLKVP